MSTTFDQSSPLSLAIKSRARDFYELTKPRMNFLVVITTAVGFYMAVSAESPRIAVHGSLGWLLLNTLFGTALTASGASVLNQWWEREFDKLMPRTRNRPLPAGRVAPSEALLFGLFLGIAGALHLWFWVNSLTAFLGAFTLLSYVLIYTPLKRRSTLNTVIGAVPGAIPPVMGFTAIHNALTPQAFCIFAILFAWQLPHFLAIAMIYRNDYAAGGFKMLPCDKIGFEMSRRQIVLWGIAMIPISLLPVGLSMTGETYFAAAVLLGLAYLSFGISCAATGSRADARKLFFASIAYLPLLLGFLMLDKR